MGAYTVSATLPEAIMGEGRSLLGGFVYRYGIVLSSVREDARYLMHDM